MSETSDQAQRRRTFAIISHPDAGKTTVTEKLLLYGGAIQLAGTVKSRKASRYARSDWMAMEQSRGISVTTSVMQFPYRERVVNLLDTPGHEDFSEDTYRTLTAVDSALMVIDAAKGVEERTIKLMDVCRLRDTPIFTFVNKVDREGRDPVELMDEVESVLGIQCAPVTWPVGMGRQLQGIYHLLQDRVYFYGPRTGGRAAESEILDGLANPELDERLGAREARALRDEIELVRGASHDFDPDRYLAGELTPVYFGSAINDFGIQLLLDDFVEHAPAPRPQPATTRTVAPEEAKLTGFVFKVQANMDPAHRDRVAFVRLCSGRFEPGMKLRHVRLGRDVKIPDALTFMAGDRERTADAYPGDIIGLHNHGTMAIGDTFTEGEALQFSGIPSFAPELFRRAVLRDPMRAKALHKGLTQLCEEGATQLFRPLERNELILGAVGPLQFDMVAERLRVEYGVECDFEAVGVATARWVHCDDARELERFRNHMAEHLAYDHADALAYLAPSRVHLELTAERWPAVRLEAVREHGVSPA